MIIIRSGTIAIVNEPWIWNVLADPYYILKTGNLFHLMIECLALIGIFDNLLGIYCEAKVKLDIPIFLQKIKNNESEYKLQPRYFNEFCKKSKLIVRLFLGPALRISSSVGILFVIFLSIKGYLDPDMNFSIIFMIITIPLKYFWLHHCLATISFYTALFYIATLHFIYQYKQVKDRVQECVKSKISRLLIEAINDHNRCTEQVQNFNKVVSIALLFIYFFGAIGIDILIHVIIHKSINVYMRLLYAITAFGFVFTLYIFTYTASSLSKSAHNLTNDLYSFMFRNKSNLRNKIKILAFIEKLCGPVIGYYCYNLFAFTTLEFYQYMAFISSTYTLLSNLLFNG